MERGAAELRVVWEHGDELATQKPVSCRRPRGHEQQSGVSARPGDGVVVANWRYDLGAKRLRERVSKTDIAHGAADRVRGDDPHGVG
jgi:hypothetical protein